MSGSSMLKKTLPVLLVIMLLVATGLIVNGLLGQTKNNPSIEDADKVYVTLKEDGNSYVVTKGEMYEELKSNVGLSTIINLVNKEILSKEKNSEGVSYLEAAVADEEAIKAKIDEAVYGEDPEDKKADLSKEDQVKAMQDFLDNMFVSFGINIEYDEDNFNEDLIYSKEIKEYYAVSVAKESYAKDVLKAAIAKENAKAEESEDEDAEGYFSDDDINDYYGENYNKSFWGIIVPFSTKAEAENALQQLGVVIDESNDVWCHAEKTEIIAGSGIYKVEAGEALTSGEVVETFIKLYNMVYKHSGKQISSSDYKVLSVEEEVKAVSEAVEKLEKAFKENASTAEFFETIEKQIEAMEGKIKEDGFTTKALSDLVKDLKDKITAYLEETEEAKKSSLKKEAEALITKVKNKNEELNTKAYVFDKTLADSPLFYEYDELNDYNSSLRGKFSNTYAEYYPFAKGESSISVNANKPVWYSYSPLSLTNNSKSFYTLSLKLGETSVPDLDEKLEAEIIAKLEEEELTDSYIETKMAELRANWSIKFFDADLEKDYISSISSYNVKHSENEKESKDVIVTIVNNKFTKVEVSSKKQFNSAKDKHGKLYVYEEGLYKSVKKYESGEEYYSKEAGDEITYKADYLFDVMEENYGMTVALSELTYQRFLFNDKFNVYKDMETGKWLDEDKRKEYMDEIETQRVNFLAGGYASYGYDPSVMSWEEFMAALYGAKDLVELAESYLYNDVLADYASGLNYILEQDDDKKYVNTDYQKLLDSALWKLYEAKMEEQAKEYFNVTGIHLLVSRYEDVKDKVGGATPISPLKEGAWDENQKTLANELIEDVVKYVKASKGKYAQALQEVQNAFEACPYYVEGNAPAIYDANGDAVKYTLTKAEVTIDVAKYKSAGLYVKYEDLSSFVNGTMVEPFNDAVKEIWDQDMADGMTNRVTLREEPIETEFGYHLYINLASAKQFTYESNVVKPLEDGSGWEYVYEDEEEEENKVEERIYPQLYEILLYNENSSHEELTSGAQTALSTYYTNLSKEFASTYLTYICQYVEVLELVEAKDANLGSLNVELVKKLINLNIKSWYENNFTIIEAEDDIHSVLLEGLKEEGGK